MAQQAEFIPYEQALELEELGFDEPCIATIDQTGFIHIKGTEYPIRGDMWYNTISAPLYQQAFRWFRKKHDIVFYLNMVSVNLYYYVIGTEPFLSFKTYEEAELECLKKLIDLVKNK